jgi:cysteine desulfurase
MGKAAALARESLGEMHRLATLRDHFETRLLATISGTAINGHRAPRLPNTSNVSFEGIESEGLLLLLDRAGICASAGSACTTGSPKPSHVLTAMGQSATRARSAIRFSLSRFTTADEIDRLLALLPGLVAKLRR